MKRILISVLLLAMCLGTFCACGEDIETEKVYAQIEMESGGVITLELYGHIAPITVANFKKLAEAGTYDGTIFHRVIKGFMIQGGDPTGTGSGDPSIENIKGEFSANGVTNNLLHERGVISMARSNDPDSASSQFFICHEDSPHLNGQYAAFGRVIAGMDVVDAIATVPTGANDRPTMVQKMKTVRIIDKAAADAAVAAETAETEALTTAPVDTVAPVDTSAEKNDQTTPEMIYAQIEMESGDVITLELYGHIAPITVANFKKLAEAGTYDGTIFHRVIQGFMIQGGDPTGTGYGDPSLEKIKGEFSANGVKNDLSHDRGVISMARADDPNSASSQFFICDSGNYKRSLDGNYAAFGRVIAGMDVVDTIAAVPTGANDRPTAEQKMKTVRIIDKATADAAVEAEKAA